MQEVNAKFLYNKNNSDTLHFKAKEGIFVLCMTAKSSCLFYLKQIDISKKIIARLMTESEAYLASSFDKMNIKIIGSQKNIDKFLTHYPKDSFKEFKDVVRNSEYELIYESSSAQLKVTKDLVEAKTDKGIDTANIDSSKLPEKIKILVVDDSLTIQKLLSKIFNRDPDLEVVATADRPSQVEALIEKHKPNLITLDIHMPEMDGVQLLKKLMPKYQIPTIMISSISMEEGPLVLNALEIGAVDYIQKPRVEDIEMLSQSIIEKVKMAVKANVRQVSSVTAKSTKVSSAEMDYSSLILIGSSTGGTEALRNVLTKMPDEIPPILIVQHIPPVFSKAFADRMNSLCNFEVKEAVDGDIVKKNRVLVAPGGKQMRLKEKSNSLYVEINDDAPVNRFKPSVDYMFKSVGELNLKNKIVAAILTGMGKDGAQEMLKLKKDGAFTLAQDEASSVVFGMPKEAIAIGAADHAVHIDEVAQKIVSLCQKSVGRKAS